MNTVPTPVSPSGAPTPNDNFRRKLIDSCIGVLMILCVIARYYHCTDLVEGIQDVKWLLEIVVLFSRH